MEENIFKTGSKKRAKDQEAIKAANNISEQIEETERTEETEQTEKTEQPKETEQSEKTEQIEKSAQKIRVNFSLSSESNEKMGEKAKEMGISKSALLQLWIHEHCD